MKGGNKWRAQQDSVCVRVSTDRRTMEILDMLCELIARGVHAALKGIGLLRNAKPSHSTHVVVGYALVVSVLAAFFVIFGVLNVGNSPRWACVRGAQSLERMFVFASHQSSRHSAVSVKVVLERGEV